MVRLDRQDEVTSMKPKKHVRIHEDSFDDDDIFSRSIITPADSTVSDTTNSVGNSESEQSSNNARILIDSSQDSCVDSKHNPTQLFLRLNFRLWDMAINSLKQNPDEARIWIETKDSSSKLISKCLPLHVACQQRSQPARGVFEALLSAYPDAAKCPDLSGALPIHVVCNNESLLKLDGKFVIRLLVQAYPASLDIPNGSGMRPLKILESLKTEKIKSSIKFVKDHTSRLILERGNSSVPDRTHSLRASPRQSSTPRSSRGNTSPTIRPLQVEEGEQGFATQLNQLRMAEMESYPIRGEVSFEAPSYSFTPSPRNIHHSTPIFESADDDCRDIPSTHVSHDVDHGEREPQDQLHCAASSGSEESGGCPKEAISSVDQSSVRELTITLAKYTKENALLRRKTSKLTQENVSFRSECNNMGALVKDLRSSVEREREFCKSQVKELEMRLASTQDKLSETEQRLQSKAKAEQALAQRISQLESNISGRRAENSTIKAALDEESAIKAILQADLQMKSEEIEILIFKDSQTRRDMEDTVSRYEDIAKELETMREVDEAHRAKIKELQFNLDEREIQLRAITEAKGMSDKRSIKAEQAYEVLSINCNELKEFLEKKSNSYDSHVLKLDKTIAGLVHDRDTLLAEKGKVIAELEINQNSISELSKKNLTLEQKLREAEKRNILLADTTIERNRVQEENEALQTQVVKLEKRASEASSMAEKSAHEIAMLQEAASSLRSEIATEQHSRAKIQEKKTELEHTLDAQIHENEAKSSLVAVLQSTITAYKSEIQRLISDQANGERNFTDASNRLTEFETRLGSSEFTRSELKKQVDKSRLQTKQIAEVTTRFQTKVAEQARTIDFLSKENKKLVEKHENLRECCNHLKVLIEQRKQTEDEQRKEVTEIRGLNRMQGDLINDLEGVICDLRSKISGYQHDNKDLVERSAGATAASRIEVTQLETMIQTLQQEAAVSKVAFRAEITKLEGAMQKLREEAAFSEETIDALEHANRALEEENVSFRQQGRVNAQSSKRDDSVIKELAQINCENLIRINELLESQPREITEIEQEATRSVCEKVTMTNGVESLSRALQKALDRNSDLQSDFEEATGKLNTLCKRQREMEDECVSIQTVNGELRKHLLEQQEDAEREKALKESYQQEVGRLQTANSELLNKLECHEMTKEVASARSVEEKMKRADEIRTLSESLQTAMACNSDLKKKLEEANEKVRTLSERQRETEGELESMQLATTRKMESLSKSLIEALERNSNLQNSLEEANEKVRSLSERQRETEGELESMQLATTDKIELLSANHQMSKERILVLQSDLEDAQEKVKMHVKRHKEIESRVESIQHVNDELRRLLLEKEEEAKKEVALKKSYENEVGRLLDANAEFLKLQDHFADKEKEAARFADEKLVMSNEVASLSSTLQKSLEQIVALQRDAEEANQDAKSLFAQKRAIEDQLASTQTVNSELQNHLLEQKGEAEKENVLNKSYQIEVGRLLKAQSTLHDELDHLRAQNDELLHQMTQLEKVHAMYEQNSIESSHKVANILATINSEVCVEKFEGQNGKSCQGTLTFDEDCFANCANIESLVKNIVVLEERIAALTVKYRHLLEEADGLRITIADQSLTIERLEDIVGRLESERKSSEPSQGADELMEIAMIAAQYTSAQPSSDPGFSPAIERSYIRDHLALTLTEVFENQHSQIKSLKEQLFVTVGKVADFHRERDEFNAVIQTLRLENNILITAGKDRDKRASKRQQKLYDENRALRESIGDLTQQTKDHQLKIMQLAAKQAALQRKKADALDVGLVEVLNQHTQVSGRDEQSSALTRGAQTPDIGSVEVVLVEESRDEQ